MPDAKPQQQEPTMEEILASIRRIIAEDERPVESPTESATDRAAEPAGDGSEVLELTDALEDDGSVRRVASAVAPAEPASADLPDGRIEPDPPRKTLEDSDIAMVPVPELRVDPRAEPGFEPDHERILSTASAGAAAAAFARLAEVPRERSDGEPTLDTAGRTIEDLVREALRPLLQAWLDQHLPDLVERLVRAEIAKVVAAAGLR